MREPKAHKLLLAIQAAYTAADLEADAANKPPHRRNVGGLTGF
jgi:hypothetical protein